MLHDKDENMACNVMWVFIPKGDTNGTYIQARGHLLTDGGKALTRCLYKRLMNINEMAIGLTQWLGLDGNRCMRDTPTISLLLVLGHLYLYYRGHLTPIGTIGNMLPFLFTFACNYQTKLLFLSFVSFRTILSLFLLGASMLNSSRAEPKMFLSTQCQYPQKS